MKHLLRLMTLGCALGMTSLVSAELLPYPIDTIKGQAVYEYRVPKSIGIYRIGVNFGVTQDEIINWNPQLKERGLHFDELIYIPVKQESPEVSESVPADTTSVNPALADTVPVVADSTTVADSTIVVAEDTLPKFKVALLLPLQAEIVQRDANMDRFMDFYEGCLIALYDLQHADRFELYVYDIGKTDMEVKRLIGDSTLHQMDAIIGPAYPAQVGPIAHLAQEDSVLTLIPFTDNVPDIQTNPFLLQFNPDSKREAQALADYLEPNKKKINCVFVESKEAETPAGIQTLQRELIARGISHTKATMHQILADSLFLSLKDSVENLLVFSTEKFGNLQILIPHIMSGRAGRKVTLYSRYSWQKENINMPQIYTSIFATAEPVDLTHYDQIFAQYFKHEHASSLPRYDLLGYDLMRKLIAQLKGKEYFGLQSDINFERVGEDGGAVNTQIQIIRK